MIHDIHIDRDNYDTPHDLMIDCDIYATVRVMIV